MNKETRTFIFGLVVLTLSAWAIAVILLQMKNGTFRYTFFDWFCLSGSIIGGLIGTYETQKTIG